MNINIATVKNLFYPILSAIKVIVVPISRKSELIGDLNWVKIAYSVPSAARMHFAQWL